MDGRSEDSVKTEGRRRMDRRSEDPVRRPASNGGVDEVLCAEDLSYLRRLERRDFRSSMISGISRALTSCKFF